MGSERAEHEAACFHAQYRSHAGVAERPDEFATGIGQGLVIAQQRRQILEQDAGLGKVRYVAYVAGDDLHGGACLGVCPG